MEYRDSIPACSSPDTPHRRVQEPPQLGRVLATQGPAEAALGVLPEGLGGLEDTAALCGEDDGAAAAVGPWVARTRPS